MITSLRVRLTVHLIGGRTLSGVYDRRGAAFRLRFARKLEDFKGYTVEAA